MHSTMEFLMWIVFPFNAMFWKMNIRKSNSIFLRIQFMITFYISREKRRMITGISNLVLNVNIVDQEGENHG